jgi:hypothetical protein
VLQRVLIGQIDRALHLDGIAALIGRYGAGGAHEAP